MKKFVKVTLSVLLIIVMLVSIPLSVSAKAKNDTPIIFISGINSSSLYLNKGTANEKRAWMPMVNDWQKPIDFLKGLTKLEDNGYNYDSYMKDVFVPFLQEHMEDLRCDGNGNSVYNISFDSTMQSYAENEIARQTGGIVFDEQEIAADTIGGNRVFRLTYDFRLSVIEAAKSLRNLVEHVKDVTGSKKVRLFAVSMGGSVLTAYLNMYAHDDLDTVMSLYSSINGTDFPAEIFSGKLNLTRDTVAACLKHLVDVVPAAFIGALESTINQVNTLWSGERLTYFYNNWIKTYIGKWAGLYNLIPADRLDECISFMLDKQQDAGLIEKLKTFQGYQRNVNKILKECRDDGVKVYILSSYNIAGLPFEGNDGQGDIIIDTKYASAGATVASFTEKTLGDDYTQKKDDGKERVSCDKIVDASTCTLPDSTWIIKNMLHCQIIKTTKDGEADQSGIFFKWLINSNEQLTVESDSKYPQFMDYTKGSGSLVPLVPVVIETPEDAKGNGEYVSSAVTTYTYTQITALGWALIAVIAALIIILIVKKSGNKEPIEGVLTKEEIKALPKGERKAAKKQNKARIKEWKREQKAAKKARKAELKAMPRKERKAAIKADKAAAKARIKELKAARKAAKKQRKIDKKAAKAAKKSK